ncbi:trypsin-like peptidase domain-containing protein [Streptomyces sp. YC504]|uniref:Trypsin-like peptidase domain-containing protein n=1 Tax=Streptomyces mesophilus TaxID=1775132 RepID=A0A6G4XPH4_9ACTN|nr:trypsin-like peptidase domain-containing protein [Streptomyces mesophilus]NGO79476.1 trypsin-like peptidase domain-containing protein [Streptomyces mesophilus]
MIDGRVVEVWCDGGYGSGYLVGPRHVLTALHVVAAGVRDTDRIFQEAPRAVRHRTSILTRSAAGGQWCEATVVWPDPDGTDAHDVALLTTEQPLSEPKPKPEPVPEPESDAANRREPAARWGRLTTLSPDVRCEFTGFAAVQSYATETPGTLLRDLERMPGSIVPGTGTRAGYLFVRPDHPLSRAAWQGMSGAAVLCNGLVTAVVLATGPAGDGRLVCRPVDTLFADQGFRAALGTGPSVEPVEFSPFLARPARRPSSSFSPVSLLRAENKAARFHGREDELRRLMDWCGEEASPPVRMLSGPGGQGKTRLALELMTRLGADWSCGFLEATTPADTAAVAGLIRQAARPTLLVVDYAETRPRRTLDRPGQIEELVDAMASAQHGTALRLLLISRSAGDWWEQVRRQSDELLHTAEVAELAPLERSPQGRRQLYEDAWTDFAVRLEAALPGWRSPEPAPPDLRHERYDAALAVQMEALAALLEPARDIGDRRAEEVILDHEERYWSKAARAAGIQAHERTQRRAVAAAALYGAADEPQAERLLAALPGLSATDEDQQLRIRLWLKDLYPAPSGEAGAYWGSLQPDLLAEYLVADELRNGADLLGSMVERCAPQQIRRGLTVLARAGLHQSDVDDRVRALVPALGENLPEAVRVVAETENPGPLLDALTGLDRGRLATAELVRLVDAIPLHSQRLAHLAAEIAADVAAHWRGAVAADGSEANRRRLAGALQDESARLEGVGRRGLSLRNLEEAVALREALPADSAEHRRELASLYQALTVELAANGRTREAAQRAQQAFETLNSLEDEDLSIGPLLRAIGTLGLRLMELGRHEEAVERIAWVTRSYDTLVAAEEAEGTAGRGATDGLRADRARWQANLATALHHAGRHDEALAEGERVVAVRRELAAARPDIHLPGLALSLHNLVGFRWVAGDPSAMEAAYEVVEIYESLTRSNPAAHLPHFVSSVRSFMSRSIRTPGDDSRQVTQVALLVSQLYGHLRESKPWVYLPALVTTVHLPVADASGEEKAMHMVMDHGTGEPRDVRQADEAVSLYRNLCKVDRRLYEPYLARALTALADHLDAAGDPSGALKTIEALIVLQRAPVDRSDEVRSHLLWAVNDAVRRLAEAERYDEAVPYARELVAVLREMSDQADVEWRTNMAAALCNIFNMVADSSKREYVLEEIVEFAQLCDGLVGDLDNWMLKAFGGKLARLIGVVTDCDRPKTAVDLAETAFRLATALYRRTREGGGRGLVPPLLMLGECYRLAGRVGDAVRAVVQGIAYARQLGLSTLEAQAWEVLALAARANRQEAEAAWYGTVQDAPFPEFRFGGNG